MNEVDLRPSFRENSLLLTEDCTGHSWGSSSPLALLRKGGNDFEPGRRVKEVQLEPFRPHGEGIASELGWTHPDGEISIPITLNPSDGDVEICIGPIEGSLPGEQIELEFPRGLGWTRAGSDGYLIIPIGLGAICDFSNQRRSMAIEKQIYSGGQTGITMPLIGTVEGEYSLGCIIDTPFDCKIKIEINRGRRHGYSQTPVWIFDNRTNYPRHAHFFAHRHGGYVTLAKRYRKEVRESGRFVTLHEKAEGDPEVDLTTGSVLGHRRLSFTEPDDADLLATDNAYGFFRKAKRYGFDRVIAHNTRRGSFEAMKKTALFARSLCPGFRLSVYENYLDIFRPGEQKMRPGVKVYPDWDETLIARERSGSLRPNWRLKRKGKPDLWTFTVCPARRLEIARPQMDQLFEALGRGSIYIDVEGAVPLFDCFDEDHPVTKADDARLRSELLREVKMRFGVVTTEALPQDFLASVVEVGSYFSVFPYSGYGNSEFRIMPPMVPIPLHTLVWHESLLNQTGTGTSYYQSDPPHAALFGWLADTMDDKGRRISYKLRSTAYAEMISHEFITTPRVIVGPDDAFHCDDVQMSRFSDGTVVIGNFASLPYRWRGRKIGSMDFIIFNERISLRLDCPPRARAGKSIEVVVNLKNTWDRAIKGSKLVLLGRGLAYDESPLAEIELPELSPGEATDAKTRVHLPEDGGKSWFVASVRVPGDQPWEVAEICRCTLS